MRPRVGVLWLVAVLPAVAAEPPIRFTPVERPMPEPNARDVYQAAIALLKTPQECECEPYLPDWRPGPDDDRFLDDPRLEDRAIYVDGNAAALAKLREGLPLTYCEPLITDFETPLPHYAKYRELARLLAMEAQLHAAEGDWEPALDSLLDDLELGIDIPHGGPLIGGLIGLAIQAIARTDAWTLVPELSADEAQAAATRLTAILADEVDCRELLDWELEFLEATLANLLGRVDWPADAARDLGLPPEEAQALAEHFRGMTRQQFYDQTVAELRQAYRSATERPGAPPELENPLAKLLVPALDSIRDKHLSGSAGNRLLLVTLALQVHRDRHGALPDRLDELVPAVLAAVPEDPFAPGQPLRYRRDGDASVLYSVGPDGDDDGGRPPIGDGTDADLPAG